jgi:hypothetical protein
MSVLLRQADDLVGLREASRMIEADDLASSHRADPVKGFLDRHSTPPPHRSSFCINVRRRDVQHDARVIEAQETGWVSIVECRERGT